MARKNIEEIKNEIYEIEQAYEERKVWLVNLFLEKKLSNFKKGEIRNKYIKLNTKNTSWVPDIFKG